MLSSKQSHKSQKEMAPDLSGFFNKMRKSLSGKHYQRNGGNFSHATQTRSQSMTIPQMDPDTAIPYIRDTSADKMRRSSYSFPSSSSGGRGEPTKFGPAVVPNGSAHMNGKLLNGTFAAMDENANSAAKRDSHFEPHQPVVSIFERQGARPKVRKSSKGDESTVASDTNALPECGSVVPEQWMHGTPFSLEPPCVEMAQPHFPAIETNCSSWSASRKEPSHAYPEIASGGRGTDFQIPPQMPSAALGTTEPTITHDPLTLARVPLRSDLALPKSSAPATETPNLRTDGQNSPPVTKTQLEPEKTEEEVESGDFADSKQFNVERPILTTAATLYMSRPALDRAQTDQISQSTSPSTQSATADGTASEDLKYSRLPGARQGELRMQQDSPQADTAGSVQRPPTCTTNQWGSINTCDTELSSMAEEQGINSCNNAPDTYSMGSESAAIVTSQERWNSDSRGTIDQTTREAKCVLRAAQVESATNTRGARQACSSEASQEVSKHCCTCTCDKSKPHPAPPPGRCYSTVKSSLKSSLTLEGIPQEVHSSSGDSPKPPTTPHIAMLVHGNGLFSDEDTKAKSLSEQDLHMMHKWNDFSLRQGTTEKDDNEFSVPRESYYSATGKAAGAVNVSRVEADTLEKETHQKSTDDSQHVLGATGGSDTATARSRAPRVDRSSKPKELSEAASRANAEEQEQQEQEPPPLPPRVPAAPSVKRPDPFAAYPIFDDDDDDFPTHEFLHELNMDIYTDPKTAIKSKSLPRNTAPSQQPSPPEVRAAKRGKTVTMRNRFSQIFKPGSKKKRHSTHGFPDRPLPDIPLNPRHPRTSANARQNALSLFGTATGDIVSQQAVKEGLLRENPSKAEVDKAREQFAVSLRRISEYGWYWGPMSWDDAESRLENMPDGSFLVRDSSDDRHLLSLSFRAQGSTHHTRVEHHNGKFSFWSQPCSHGSASIVEFVEEAMRHSHSGRVLYFLRPRMPGYPPAAVQLLYPISRFQKSRSLQHMCRFVIRKHVRLDHIDSLPLPRRLKDYLKEAQYYTQEDILH